ncbi:HD domain-containing protein [Pyronema omphalodes]|nr:HD domain-containing protein [Pyronema omphalodes]
MTTIIREKYTPLDIPAFQALYASCEDYAREYMSRYDASHDWSHIERVRSLSIKLMSDSPISIDTQLVSLAAILHDIGDHKYVTPGSSPTPVKDLLISFGCPEALAISVQIVVSNVSYSNETKNGEEVAKVLEVYPELGIVQDADRLDAIGAVGIGRCFTFGGAKKRDTGMQGCITHFEEKLVKIHEIMKTERGRQMAVERTERIKEFERWWNEEVGETGVTMVA